MANSPIPTPRATDGGPAWAADAPIRIGISSCLLGEEVRFDTGHKRDPFLVDTAGQFVDYVSVCPEVEVGMGTPRETVRLIQLGGDPNATRLIAPKSGTDWTEPMRAYALRRARALANEELCGYVLKKDSPSCGMERVRLYQGDAAQPGRGGVGLFAAALMAELPLLPVEEEGRLHDPRLRDNFWTRVFAYRRLRSMFDGRFRRGDLVAFHTREKLLLMAHDRPAYVRLGQLVAAAKATPPAELARDYQTTFMTALRRLATARKHANVLQHVAGYFKKLLGTTARTDLQQVIDDYRLGHVPLIVPVTLARHYVRVHGVEYLAGQTYLEPHPKELMLRNHV